MAFQLIYTSYPKSLVVGRTGFSTVARSADMNEKLAAAVERCSVYDIGEGEVFSHRILSQAGENWHVLTRISDSGVDYTNRNNYIAHHLVLSESEIDGLANPAEILAQWTGWKTSWNQDPQYIENVSNLHTIKAKNSLPAKNWQTIFGSPAKAALLFGENVTISASPQDAHILLDLYSESLLINTKQADAWHTTFTTSFSSSENANDFMWKAMPNCESASINLSARIAPNAPNNRASEYATTGLMTNRERLNLQVKAPVTQTRFKVVQTKTSSDFSTKKIYIASAVISILALIVIAYLLIDTNSASSDDFGTDNTPKPLPKLVVSTQTEQQEQKPNATQTNVAQKPSVAYMTLLDTINAVREQINSDKYTEALALWDNSPHAKNNPSLREDILADIGTRVDTLLKYAENAISIPDATIDMRKTAIENLSKVEVALKIQDIPRKDRRFNKWKTLNDKIQK